jgi:hypothetical protein
MHQDIVTTPILQAMLGSGFDGVVHITNVRRHPSGTYLADVCAVSHAHACHYRATVLDGHADITTLTPVVCLN